MSNIIFILLIDIYFVYNLFLLELFFLILSFNILFTKILLTFRVIGLKDLTQVRLNFFRIFFYNRFFMIHVLGQEFHLLTQLDPIQYCFFLLLSNFFLPYYQINQSLIQL
jgi:hypothetical protein